MLLEDILIQAGVEYEHQHTDNNEVLMACPFCTGTKDVSGNRHVFGLNLMTGFAHCYRCDWGSRSVVYTAKELCREFGIEFSWRLRLSATEADDAVDPVEKAPEAEPVPLGLPEGYERFSFQQDSEAIERKALRYARERGITFEDIATYKIGYAIAGEMSWRLIFPVFGEDKQVYGCVGRDFSKKASVPYLNTPGIKLLLNGHRRCWKGVKLHTAVVVEGAIDMVHVNHVLEQRFLGYVGIGALGAVITSQQLAQLAKYDRVIHFPDWDVPGVKGAIKRADACKSTGLDTYVIEPREMNGSDPGDMSEDLIATCLQDIHPWSNAERMRMRVRATR